MNNTRKTIYVKAERPFSKDNAWDLRYSIVRNDGYEIFEITIDEVRGIIICLQQALDTDYKEKQIERFSHGNVMVLTKRTITDKGTTEVHYQISRDGVSEMQRITTDEAKDVIVCLQNAVKLHGNSNSSKAPGNDFLDLNVYAQAEYFCSKENNSEVSFGLYMKNGSEITGIIPEEVLDIIGCLQHAISINSKENRK